MKNILEIGEINFLRLKNYCINNYSETHELINLIQNNKDLIEY